MHIPDAPTVEIRVLTEVDTKKKLICEVEAEPKANITWLRENVTITEAYNGEHEGGNKIRKEIVKLFF